MNKYLWINALCGLSFLCSPLAADEIESTEMVHASLGNRKAADAQYAVDQEKRLAVLFESEEKSIEEKSLNNEKANFEPSEEMLAACRECKEVNQDSLFNSEENATQLHSKATYLTTHPNALHFVTAVTLPYGDPIQLEDGSIWSLYTGDSYKTLNWLTTDNILIMPNRNPVWNSIYPYSLLNQQTGVAVQATYSAAPWMNSGYSRWIYSIDYYNCQMVLNDGSIWNVPFCDSWILNTYLPGDYVIMGFNDAPGNGLGYNILINFNTLQYVYSTCIYY